MGRFESKQNVKQCNMNNNMYKCNMNNMKPELCVVGQAVPLPFTLVRVDST